MHHMFILGLIIIQNPLGLTCFLRALLLQIIEATCHGGSAIFYALYRIQIEV